MHPYKFLGLGINLSQIIHQDFQNCHTMIVGMEDLLLMFIEIQDTPIILYPSSATPFNTFRMIETFIVTYVSHFVTPFIISVSFPQRILITLCCFRKHLCQFLKQLMLILLAVFLKIHIKCLIWSVTSGLTKDTMMRWRIFFYRMRMIRMCHPLLHFLVIQLNLNILSQDFKKFGEEELLEVILYGHYKSFKMDR